MAPLWSVAFLHPQIERLWVPRNGVGLDSLGLNPGSIVVIVSDSLGQSLKFSESWFLLLQNDHFKVTREPFKIQTQAHPFHFVEAKNCWYFQILMFSWFLSDTISEIEN